MEMRADFIRITHIIEKRKVKPPPVLIGPLLDSSVGGATVGFIQTPMKALLMAFLTIAAVSPTASRAELPPLIPRDLLFGNPERTSPALSPDGTRMAWLAPDTNNVLQVWVQTIGAEDSRIVTADKRRGIRQYLWAEDNRTLLYLQDSDGDENFHIYGVDLASGNVRDFTPIQGVRAMPLDTHADFPNEVLVMLNLRNRALFDVYRLHLDTGALVLDTENPGDVSSWLADAKFRVRLAQVTTPDGGTELRVRADEKAAWKTFLKVGPDEILDAIGFSQDGQSIYLTSSVGRDTAAVVRRNLADGQEVLVAASDVVDAGGVLFHPRKHIVQAVAFSPGRTAWKVVDASVEEDFAALAKVHAGDFTVVNRTGSDATWLVAFDSDRAPGRFYQWDRKNRQATFLFTTRPKLEDLALAEMKPVVIPARDGLKMHSYLTLPVGVPARGLPLILLPHGGPWARDSWGFNGLVQWLANRGYAVLQPNFRGSTGYGKSHLNAGNRQWGLKMHDDLIDAVQWAVKEGIADPQRVGILGGSYGGYAALAGLAFTPDVFACGVSIVGPSNIRTLLNSIPPYWKPLRGLFAARLADPDNPADEALIRRASPLFSADRINRPLLIGQGANDPRVKQAESEQIVGAIEKNGGGVTYVLYPDEGHGFARPENRTDFNARTEGFLARHLGGRSEPMTAERVPGSTAVVREILPRP